ISAPCPSTLLTAHAIKSLSEIVYPEGIESLRVELNVNVRDDRFRCIRLLLMWLIHICKEKPPTLSALDGLGIKLINQ
ncbi:hypothetical protein BD769DRAFT_1340858, partial [Suillus cothurnatus]